MKFSGVAIDEKESFVDHMSPVCSEASRPSEFLYCQGK